MQKQKLEAYLRTDSGAEGSTVSDPAATWTAGERRESGDNVVADLDAYVREVEANSGMANMLRQ